MFLWILKGGCTGAAGQVSHWVTRARSFASGPFPQPTGSPRCNLLIKPHMCQRTQSLSESFINGGLYVIALVLTGHKLWQTHNITVRGSVENDSCFLSLTLSNMFTLMAKYAEKVFLHKGGGETVSSLIFFSGAGRDWWQEDYWSSERLNQDEHELWTMSVRLLHTPKTLRYNPFHRFTLSLLLSGQAVERYPLRSQRAPWESQEDWNVEKHGWTLSTVQSCENPGVLSEKFLRKRLEESQVGEMSGEIMLVSTQEALREVRFNLLSWEYISQM